MLEILKFIFSGFWTFWGVVILITVLSEGLEGVFNAIFVGIYRLFKKISKGNHTDHKSR